MSRFVGGWLPPQAPEAAMDEGYRAMAADQAREAEAQAWCSGWGRLPVARSGRGGRG